MSILNFSLLFTVVMTAIAVKETVDKLRKERDFDALTQVLNRRSFRSMPRSGWMIRGSTPWPCWPAI